MSIKIVIEYFIEFKASIGLQIFFWFSKKITQFFFRALD